MLNHCRTTEKCIVVLPLYLLLLVAVSLALHEDVLSDVISQEHHGRLKLQGGFNSLLRYR
jgi:hypothetical protein